MNPDEWDLAENVMKCLLQHESTDIPDYIKVKSVKFGSENFLGGLYFFLVFLQSLLQQDKFETFCMYSYPVIRDHL